MPRSPSIGAPVFGFTRKFSPVLVVTRRRSTVGLKAIPYPPVATCGRAIGVVPSACTKAIDPVAPTAVATPVLVEMV